MESSRHWCQYMGFKVMSPHEQMQEDKKNDEITVSEHFDFEDETSKNVFGSDKKLKCFNGVPR